MGREGFEDCKELRFLAWAAGSKSGTTHSDSKWSRRKKHWGNKLNLKYMKLKLPVRPGSEENQEILEYREITAYRCQSLKIARKKKKTVKTSLDNPSGRHPIEKASKLIGQQIQYIQLFFHCQNQSLFLQLIPKGTGLCLRDIIKAT